MPSPSSALSTLRPDLASFMEFDLAMDRAGFIGHRVFPFIEVAREAGTFGKITIESLLADRKTERAPGAGYARSDFKFTTESWTTEEHGAEETLDDRLVKVYAEFFQAEQIATARAVDVVLRNQEKRIADILFNDTTFASHTTGVTNEWDDADAATPIDDVEAAVQAIWDATGLWPNALILNRRVFRNLRNCDQIIERIASSGAGESTVPGRITVGQLAQVFDLKHILIAGSAKNTADEGQDASIASIWSNEYAMVCRIAESNDIQEPCLGRGFHWSEDGSTLLGTVESYREENRRSEIIRVRHDVDEKLLYTEMGYLLSNITTI